MSTPRVETAAQVADRLDELADAADLMDDTVAATRLREQAHRIRMEAMRELER